MLEKLAAFAKTKAALALVGVAVVGGGSGAVALAATSGHLSTLGVNLNDSNGDSHGHTEGVEGLLTGCTSSTISVKDDEGKSWTFKVTSSTKFNGDVKSGTEGAASTKGTETGDHAGSSTTKGTETGDHAGSSTGAATTRGSDTGDHAGSSTSKGTETGDTSGKGTETGDSKGDTQSHSVTLAQVCAAANINVRKVQVQATKTSSGYEAWKVTLQGADKNSNEGGSSTEGKGTDSTDGGASSGGSSSTHP